MWSINELQNVWHLAAKLHNGQKYGGQEEGETLEYLNHIGSVTFEILNAIQIEGEKINSDLAIKCAVLHDSIEDTEQSFEQIKELFGLEVALGIMALTKDKQLQPKEKMMLDSLNRIKKQPKEVWAVKMADRICNLYAPPYSWSKERKEKYLKEARLIHRALKDGNKYLANRLEEKINEYSKYF
ncbi:MAG: bifunctional (p)ppGpp synthetase/guanosine-3',5'-bis(diphosphate) 3'-pyrophosphohydrolase [Flavobacteriales bacterium]